MKTQTRLAISLSDDPMDTEYVTVKDAQKEVADLQKQIELFNQNSNEQDQELHEFKVALSKRTSTLKETEALPLPPVLFTLLSEPVFTEKI